MRFGGPPCWASAYALPSRHFSVVNQLVKAGVIDDVFSLCFGMVEGDGALLLGDAEVPGSIALQYTPLLSSASHPFYYNVKMLSLAVDGQLLPVPQVGCWTLLRSAVEGSPLQPDPASRIMGFVSMAAPPHRLSLVAGTV